MKSSTGRRSALRARRRVEHAWSYGLPLRLADHLAGRRDRRSGADVSEGTPWQRGLEATWRENDQRNLARTGDRLAPTVKALHHRYGEWNRLDRQIAETERTLAALPEPVLAPAGSGESHLSDVEIAARRRREHGAARSAILAELDRLHAQQTDARTQSVALRAMIAEEYEIARETSERLRWYYTRRLATYTRSLTATRTGAGTGGTRPADSWQLPVAPWTTRPAPWVPAGFDDAVTTTKEYDDAVR